MAAVLWGLWRWTQILSAWNVLTVIQHQVTQMLSHDSLERTCNSYICSGKEADCDSLYKVSVVSCHLFLDAAGIKVQASKICAHSSQCPEKPSESNWFRILFHIWMMCLVIHGLNWLVKEPLHSSLLPTRRSRRDQSTRSSGLCLVQYIVMRLSMYLAELCVLCASYL
jgi:hypothetical protein